MNEIKKNEGAAPWPVSAPPIKNEIHHTQSIQSSLKISNLEASQFLNLIAEGEQITFQTFDDMKGRHSCNLVRVLHGTLEQHLPILKELNEQGAGIFFTVNKTDLKGRETKNIKKVRAVFVDLDGAPLEPILSAPLAPHIVVESSPKRFHAYWLIEELPLEQFSLVQKALIKRFDGDPVIHDLPRVMRLPGFIHRKGDPVLVRVIDRTEALPYKAVDFLQSLKIDLTQNNSLKGSKLRGVQDPILQELNKRKMVRRELPNKSGAWDILCPFAHLHTTGDQGTIYFEAHTNGYKGSGFKCQHSHCEGKGIEDLRDYLNLNEEWGTPLLLKEELHPVASFREEMLPETLRQWIMDNAERMQVPPDFLAATCVVVLGSLIGRKIGIFPKAHDDWLVIPNLWGAVVGRPSLLKSPAVAEMMKPLDTLASKAIYKHRGDLEAHEQKEMWIDAQKSAQKEEMKKAARKKSATSQMPQFCQVESISKPVVKRYKTEDGTVEKIGEILLENPQGILIHRDELVGWLKGLDKYGREGDRAFFLESWNGNGPYTVDRIGRGTLHIPALCLSVIGGIQPGPLGSYVHQATTGGGGDDGLLQRFQILVWPDAPKKWENIDRKPNLDAKERAFEVFRQMDAFAPFEPSLNEAFETCKLHFTSEAQNLFDEWRTRLEQRLRNGELDPALESHLAKYRSLMPSLALIFYLIEAVGKGVKPIEVDLQAAHQAIQWCDYLETHAKRLYASRKNPNMDSATALLDRIKKGDLRDGFAPREVYHARHWAYLDDADKVNSAIKILEDFGWIKIELLKTPGRPSTKIRIHPQLRGQQ